ncbi:trypsin-like serine peptidase [Roseomonas rosulenta]|uniref:trypsin-like serine peptidase n=1 Tax=Roseomonas rosulenta TaxID=2748667 RepID=UPI0018E0107A|nr:trypsin-like serine protease [Roseomonas rosulenta]
MVPRRCVALVAALLLAQAAPAAPQEVPGLGARDPRQGVPADRAPWNAVGEIEASTNRCTGTLVGPRSVVTAQHCLIDSEGRALVRPGEVVFRLGGRMARAVAIQAGQGFDIALEQPWRSDWALLTLDTPMGEGRALRLAREPPREGTPLVLPGWQHDRPGALVADLNCRVLVMGTFGGQGMLVGHNCAGTMGSSGAPLIAHDGSGGYVVVGVQAKAALGRALGVAVPGFSIPQR